jgi:formate C-acetyltransferase
MMDWLAGVYVNAMNVIHYMHDKYAYERIEMALHDYARSHDGVRHGRLSVVADSFSAMKHARYRWCATRRAGRRLRDRGEFPLFATTTTGSTSWRAWVRQHVHDEAAQAPHLPERDAHQSILTITSNVVYGKATATHRTAAGRESPSRPARTRLHGRDSHGLHASAASVAKIPYRDAQDGISLTTTLVPDGPGAGGAWTASRTSPASWTASSAPPAST